MSEPEILTEGEYLRRERAARDVRSEYRDGHMVAMSGASVAHNIVSGNLFALLWTRLRGGSCRPFMNDLKVRIHQTTRYTYPDVVVVCGDPIFRDDQRDTLVNPTLIIEVLSESTEAYDRGEKFEHYQRIESLREYVLVAQDRPVVERYVRQGEFWLYSLTAGLEASVTFESVGTGSAPLALADIYEGVLPPAA
jgi:Uncharacterized protein conserved in cyanobacteria